MNEIRNRILGGQLNQTSDILSWRCKKTKNINWDAFPEDLASLGIPTLECVTTALTDDDVIGTGNSMIVYRSSVLIDGVKKEVALKRHKELFVRKRRKEVLNEIWHEAKLMSRINHPNVVRIVGVTYKMDQPILVVELANEDLESYLDGNTVEWEEKRILCLQVLRGVMALHKAGAVLGDLKGENVLVFIGADGSITAKISDFGYSSTLSSSGRTYHSSCSNKGM